SPSPWLRAALARSSPCRASATGVATGAARIPAAGAGAAGEAAATGAARVRATAAAVAVVLAAAARRGAGRLGIMGIRRIGKHLLEHHWRVKRVFPPRVLERIEQAIKAGETTHSGQVRFVVEGALDGAPLFRDQGARSRALDVFSHLRIWD